MNIGRVYSPLKFIARGIDRSTEGIGAHHAYWEGVHHSNTDREGYRPLGTG